METRRVLLILYLVILLSQFGCSKLEDKHYNILDCVLENAIGQVDDETEFNILGTEMIGWSDSTSLIILTFPKKELTIVDDDIVYKSTYLGRDVYLRSNFLIIDKTGSRVNKSKYLGIWNSSNIVFEEENIVLNNDLFMPPYSPPEVQFEYNYNEDCIQSILLLRWIEEDVLIENCRICEK